MSWLKLLKLKSAVARLEDESLYAAVYQEIEAGIRREGLWAKAIADSDGHPDKVKALYVRYRAQAIRDEIQIAESITENALKPLAASPVTYQLTRVHSGIYKCGKCNYQISESHREWDEMYKLKMCPHCHTRLELPY